MRALRLFVLCLLLVASGCATSMNELIQSKHNGTKSVYPVSSDQAWEITKKVFRWEGTDLIEEHKDERYMLTSYQGNPFIGRTIFCAWVEPVGQSETQVTIIIRGKTSLDMNLLLDEETFHERFMQAVKIVKSGQPLPGRRPK